jgi:hypothetical protein
MKYQVQSLHFSKLGEQKAMSEVSDPWKKDV